MPASEIATAERESESKSPERAASVPAMQTAPGAGEPRLAGGSADSTARMVSNVAMRHPSAAVMRASAMRHAQRSFGNRAMQEALSDKPRAARTIQRSCSCGGTCDSCQAAPVEPVELIQRKPVGAAGGEVDASVIPDTTGQPLDRNSQQLLQAGMGEDLSAVRVHTDARAADSAAALQADAYTFGRNIYFAAGKYSPGSSEGTRLIAHEVTHTLQQSAGEAPTEPALHDSVMVRDVDDPMEREAEQVADAVVTRSTVPEGGVMEDRAPAIRRDFSLSGAWDATGGAAWRGVKRGANAVGEAAGDLWDAAKDTAAAFIDTIAPGLLPFLRDVGGALFDKITSGLGSLMGGLSERIKNQGVAGAIAGIFADLASSLGKAIGQLVTGSCQSMVAAASAVVDFVKEIGGEELAELGKAAKAVGGFFSDVWDDLGAPALDAIQKAAGTAWTWIKDKATWVWDLLLPVRKASATAWDWIKRQFNIAKEEGAGILDWLYDKAKEQWFKIRDKIAPILGPLKAVAAALILLSPLGPIILIWKGAPILWNALKWIWAHGIKPVGEALRDEFREHILPTLISGVDTVTAVLDDASAFLCEHAGSISTGLQSLRDALAGIPFLSLASKAVGVAVTFFGNLAGKGKCKFSDLVGEVKNVLRKIYEFVKPVLEILRQAVLIAAFGPLAILDDGVWSTLNQFIAFAKKVPCVREMAGLLHVDGAMRVVGEVRANLKDIWDVISNQDRFEAEIHKALDGLLALIPGKVEALAGEIAGLDGPHLHILLTQFLFPKIANVAGHWKDTLINVVWDLVWPWPGVIKDVDEAEKHAGKLKTDLWDFEFNKAADDGLAIWRDVNGIIGHLYGWFFLAAVLIGAVFASPQAGAAVAYEVGEALLVSTLLAEGLTILKSQQNLMADARLAMPRKDREASDHEDYESMSGSIVNLAVLGVMSVLGELAVDFAKAVFAEIKGIFLPEAAEAPAPETHAPGDAPKPDAPPTDAPKTDAPKTDAPQTDAPKTDAPKTDAPQTDAGKPGDPESAGPEDQPTRKGKLDGELKKKVNDVLDGRRPLSDLTPEEARLAADYYDEVASGIKDNPGAEGSKSTAADRRAFNRERARFLREGTGNPPKKLFDFLKDHETAVPDATPTDAPPTDAPPTDAPPTDATPAKKPGTDPGEPQGCFVAGTMVLTPGGLRPIETLAVGGAIICSDPDVLEKRTCEVASVMRHTVPAVLRVIVGETAIVCSAEHPFWVPGSGWRTAGELAIGTPLLSLDLGVVNVSSIQAQAGPVEVFNLSVGGPHIFLVSALEIFVHNKAAARGALGERVQGLKSRASKAVGQAEALPPETPGRGDLVDRAKNLGDQLDRLAKDTEGATPAEREQILEPDFTDNETELGDLEEELEAAKRKQLEDKLQDLQDQRADAEGRKADFEKEAARLEAKANELWDQSYQKHGAERRALQDRAMKAGRQADIARQKANGVRGELEDIYGDLKRTDLQLRPEERSVLPCFASGTLVWTADGPRPIDSLAAGDMVLAQDFTLGRAVSRRVLEIYRNRTERFYHVHVEGTAILATGMHRFWVESLRDWVAARDLEPGMPLRLVSGAIAFIQSIEAVEANGAATWNLQIEDLPNYFVGPGTLVHNANPARYDFGDLRIYRGTNPDPKFADRVYIGQTDDLGRRQGEHRATAETRLKDPNLTPEQREFYEFMKGVELDELVSGLSKPQADYLEQKNIDIETNAQGENNVMNRREQVDKKNMPDLEEKIRMDPEVLDQGFCK